MPRHNQFMRQPQATCRAKTYPSVAGFHGVEFAIQQFLAHAVDQRKRACLAHCADDFLECCRKRRFGYDFGFNASRKALGPGLIVALDCGQALLFPYQGVQLTYAFNAHTTHPIQNRLRADLSFSLNVPLRTLAQPNEACVQRFAGKLMLP